MRRLSWLALAAFVAPIEAHALEPNLLVGYGVIGPDQYDQGKVRAVITVNGQELATKPFHTLRKVAR